MRVVAEKTPGAVVNRLRLIGQGSLRLISGPINRGPTLSTWRLSSVSRSVCQRLSTESDVSVSHLPALDSICQMDEPRVEEQHWRGTKRTFVRWEGFCPWICSNARCESCTTLFILRNAGEVSRCWTLSTLSWRKFSTCPECAKKRPARMLTLITLGLQSAEALSQRPHPYRK